MCTVRNLRDAPINRVTECHSKQRSQQISQQTTVTGTIVVFTHNTKQFLISNKKLIAANIYSVHNHGIRGNVLCQHLSNLNLKALVVGAAITSSGSLFQGATVLTE